ncbi:gamma-type small acid-soluble spore protein [Filibacter tadaridae]|uniref:Small, acid-soluble spore protein gamma-type n=1 Tax=Filibacter tadaridae TaxID=2483811 RepID=A0A3P5WMC1_9BACL|nr:gamma-type small acid-soluble spore protein [Filibacter tadaridae]VDC22705.1 Small, acid-soluble spore protein gamma-type [Filibacter tadaridae]
MTNNNPNQTDANQVRKQNQRSQQQSAQNTNNMSEEIGSITDVEQVRKQNQQSEANMKNASGARSNQFENGSK